MLNYLRAKLFGTALDQWEEFKSRYTSAKNEIVEILDSLYIEQDALVLEEEKIELQIKKLDSATIEINKVLRKISSLLE